MVGNLGIRRLRAKIQSRGDGYHLQEICVWAASSPGGHQFQPELFQGRTQATTYEQASHYPYPESFVAPTGFALEGLKICEKGLQENRKRTGPRRQRRTT